MSEKLFLSGDDVELTLGEDNKLDLCIKGGQKHEKLQPKRLFPISAKQRYISLVDVERNEVAIITDAATLDKQSQKALAQSLADYYILPKIQKVNYINWKHGTLTVIAVTDYGECTFKVRSRPQNIKRLGDGRVLIKDINDNRYEITDSSKMDKKTVELMLL